MKCCQLAWTSALVALLGCPGTEPQPPPIDDGELHDPLSMPRSPTLEISDFTSAKECERCHPTHYAQWSGSTHAYAMIDPVFRVLVMLRQQDFEGRHDQFCNQCHSAIGTRGGELVKGFSFDSLSTVVAEGVTCEACHKVASMERLHNSGHRLDPRGPMRGSIKDPMPSGFHESEYDPLFERADICGGCHDVLEYTGLNLERPFEEFSRSPARGEKTCQTCHMPTYMGEAAVGGPIREVHDHRFVGVGLPMVDGFIEDPEVLEDRRTRVQALLKSAASLELIAQPTAQAGAQIDLVVTVKNEIDAHNFPTGSTFNRQAWLEVIATDAEGNVLYKTGDLDELGDLRNFFSEVDPYGDEDLIDLASGLVDAEGTPTLFSWKASEHVSATISPLYSRTHTLFVPTSSATLGPVEISARLRFRTFGPFLLRTLGLGELVDKLEITDLDERSISVEIQ